MNQFLACCKKEWLEMHRTRKLKMYIGVSVGMVLLVFLMFFMMNLLAQSEKALLEGTVMGMFKPTYNNSLSLFMSMMSADFLIILIILTMNVVSKELSQKKWTLPVSSGIKPENLIASKFVVVVATITGTILLGCVIHFTGTLIFFKKDIAISQMLYSYSMLIVAMAFVSVFTIAINAMTKSAGIACGATFILVFVVRYMLAGIKLGKTSLGSYTPMLFFQESVKMQFVVQKPVYPPVMAYISGSLSTIIFAALLIFLAIRSSKITAQNLQS